MTSLAALSPIEEDVAEEEAECGSKSSDQTCESARYGGGESSECGSTVEVTMLKRRISGIFEAAGEVYWGNQEGSGEGLLLKNSFFSRSASESKECEDMS